MVLRHESAHRSRQPYEAGAHGAGLCGECGRLSRAAANRRKSSVHAKVEHVFGVIKRVFGFQKVCYRGLAKNLHRLEVSAALANLFLSRRRLLNA
jgi:transposase, IS5 family